jgi:cell division septum initiation protein DivIVA
MSNLNQLSSSVQNLAKQYAAVIEVGKFLGTLGALDTLANEIEERVSTLRKNEQEATAALYSVQSAIAEHTAAHEANIKASRAQAEKIVSDAAATACIVLETARDDAQHIEQGAKARLEAHDGEFLRLQDALADVNASIAQRTADLTAINEAIEAARAKFA